MPFACVAIREDETDYVSKPQASPRARTGLDRVRPHGADPADAAAWDDRDRQRPQLLRQGDLGGARCCPPWRPDLQQHKPELRPEPAKPCFDRGWLLARE